MTTVALASISAAAIAVADALPTPGAGPAPSVADSAGAVVAPVFQALAGRNGWLLQALTAMAGLRAFFKPVMTLLESVLGPGPAAARAARWQSGWVGRALAFVLDLAASVKLHLVLPPAGPGPVNGSKPPVLS